MKFKHLISFILIVVSVVLLISCGSSTKEQIKDAEDFKDNEDTLVSNIEEVVYNIPSPSELPYLLQATGAEYNETLLNQLNKVDQYMSRHDKAALNLGVYAADIGYLTAYNKTQESIDYLSAVKKLADNLDVVGAFDADIIKRFEANISNKDSLTHVLDATIKNTETFLNDHSRNKLSALVVAGSFIEGLYISTGIVKSYPKNLLSNDKRNLVLTPIVRVVLEQKKSVTELLNMMKSVEQTDPVTAMVADLTALEKTYAALDIEEQIKNNRSDLILTDQNLALITTLVGKMRNDIVQ